MCIRDRLVSDESGDFTRPVNFRKRYYRILKAAGIELKGLHSLRHTFATNLVNGVKQEDGSIKSLTPRQVADLLGPVSYTHLDAGENGVCGRYSGVP